MQATQIASATQMSTHATFTGSLLFQRSAWWTTECSPVYASPRDKESEGRTMEDIDAQRWCLAKNTQGKAMANHPCQHAKKTVMDQVNSNKEVVADGETPRPECDSTATGKERDGELKAIRSNEASSSNRTKTERRSSGGSYRRAKTQPELQKEDEDRHMECP